MGLGTTKADLIALHARMYRLREHLLRLRILPASAFTRYDALNASPVHIHHSRDHHHTAAMTLSECIDEALAQRVTTEEARRL